MHSGWARVLAAAGQLPVQLRPLCRLSQLRGLHASIQCLQGCAAGAVQEGEDALADAVIRRKAPCSSCSSAGQPSCVRAWPQTLLSIGCPYGFCRAGTCSVQQLCGEGMLCVQGPNAESTWVQQLGSMCLYRQSLIEPPSAQLVAMEYLPSACS